MMNKLSGWDDTIVALSTAPGVAAIAVIRLSGANAFTICNSLFPSKDLMKQPSHSLHVGLFGEKESPVDEVVLSIFKGPKSYTGEDVVEISCHGSVFIQQKIIQVCVSRGARIARPGEFTQRAFLHGKLDLAQAEAVADLIISNTEASQKTALNNIRGGFSEKLAAMREQLIQFASLIELELDFAEEDVAFADREKFENLISELLKETAELMASFQLGNVIKNGVRVAIIGKPNAGKSTLLNTLLNEDRAIVSDIAGTTRDTIEELLNINGILFQLIDTAGIRAHSTDIIENIGMGKSLEKMKTADLVLYIFDADDEDEDSLKQQVEQLEEQKLKYLLLANKADLQPAVFYENKFSQYSSIHYISAKNKTGIETLKTTLFYSATEGSAAADQTIVTNARHFDALQKIHHSLLEIKTGLGLNRTGDLLAPDIRTCLYHLGDITGEVTNEDKLDYIFSKFCIGK